MKIYLGARAGATFPHVPVRDGHEIAFGRCRLRFLEAPGHTVESATALVTDLDRSPEPGSLYGKQGRLSKRDREQPAAPRRV